MGVPVTEAPTEDHRKVWLRMMKRLQGDLEMQAGYLRRAIREQPADHADVEGEPMGDGGYYALRAWAADQILAELKRIPIPDVAPDPRRGMTPGPAPGLPTVNVGGIDFVRKVCDAGMDGECYGVGCPQRDPATRLNFCPLPTGNPWVALRES